MSTKPTSQSSKPASTIHPHYWDENSPIQVILLASFLLVSVLLSAGCATVLRPVPMKPLTIHEATNIIADIRDQGDKVSSFYALGSVLVKDWKWESEADILIAGIRTPPKIKIEITHPWGKPILHILIDNNRLEVLSFDEKKLYLSDFTPEALSDFFPGEFFDHNLIWAVLRGYPNLLSHYGIESRKTNQISLFNNRDTEVEVIDLYAESLLPKKVSFPEKSLTLLFSGFKENDGIYYAWEVTVENIKGNRDLKLRNRRMVFNRTIPDQIFTLEKLPAFETVYMDKEQDASKK